MNFKFLAPIAMTMVAFIVFIIRRPDIVVDAQFWAEDGSIWYADAFNHGVISSVVMPQNGYFQTISRLTMSAAMLLPIEWAPLFANLVGLTARSVIVGFLFSQRFSWIDLRAKILMVVFFLLMPDLFEVHANITNTHWYLSIYMLMIIAADEPRSTSWKVHDAIALTLAGLSGPFVIFAAPAVVLKYVKGFDATSLRTAFTDLLRSQQAWIIATTSFIQAMAILLSADASRSAMSLGATPETLAQILASRVFLGSFVSYELRPWIWHHVELSVAATVLSFCILLVMLLMGGWRARAVIIFAALMLAAALARPMLSLDKPQWDELENPYGGGRYFVNIAIFWLLILIIAWHRLIGRFYNPAFFIALIALVWGAVPTLRIGPVPSSGFQNTVAEGPKPDAQGIWTIPIAPIGWAMHLHVGQQP